jgi:hypothetical protein
MKKGSFNPDLAKQGGLVVEKGKFQVKSAKIQNRKTDYRENQMYLILSCAVLDDNYNQVRESEDIDLQFSFGKESLKHFRPAVGKNVNDTDPVEQSDAPDAEGNTFGLLDNEPVNRSTAVMVLYDSLVKQGFPKATLDLGWAPLFVGMQFELATYTSKECNEKFGTRLNTRPIKDEKTGEEKLVSYRVCVKWQNPNYLSSPVSVGVLATSTSTATSSPVSGGVSATTTESDKDLLTRVIKVVADRKKGSEIKTEEAFHAFVTNEYIKHNPKLPSSRLAAVQALAKNALEVAKSFIEAGLPVELNDDGQPKPITYPVSIPA